MIREEIICHTRHLQIGEERVLSFWDIFMDDRWAMGDILCPEEVFAEIGGFNTRLTLKRDYELLLRIAFHYPVRAIGTAHEEDTMLLPEDTWEAFREDCYVTGKYQQELLGNGYFDSVVESLLSRVAKLENSEESIEWLEKMITHESEYYEIDDNVQPILIYKTDDSAYNLLNVFAQQLAASLLLCRQRVEIFDVQLEGNQALTRLIGRRYKAVIGIQSYVFSVMMRDNITNLHDLIEGPKFNMILDHPAWMKEHFGKAPKNYHLLIHDRNYLRFADQYFNKIGKNYYFQPAGVMPTDVNNPKKLYDVTFIGTYHDYRERLNVIRTYDRKQRFLTTRYMSIMKQHPNITAENAFRKTLDYYNLKLSDWDFVELFYETRQACFCIMSYFREKIIYTLLNGGIKIDVFGESWKKAPYAEHKNLISHPELLFEESLKVMGQSKISLNVMSWHKDGFTERVINAMLCRSVVLSDKSSYLEEEFEDQKELILFNLEKLGELPVIVNELLANDEKISRIAERGYEKASQKHLWIHRGNSLLDLIDNTSN